MIRKIKNGWRRLWNRESAPGLCGLHNKLHNYKARKAILKLATPYQDKILEVNIINAQYKSGFDSYDNVRSCEIDMCKKIIDTNGMDMINDYLKKAA